ncbi:MAG TPA: hypothetical protein VD969_01210 [Symbiobacteriaceae bacterium]|nr:hypothetical protein [Symbiobacteriaceae bacterium]
MQMPQPPVYYPPRPRRRWTAGKVIVLLVLLLLVGAVVLLGLTGLVPGVSKVVGASSARNLGVKATPADFARVVTGLGYQLDNLPNAQDPAQYRYAYSGQMNVDREFTQEELSALLTYNHVSWWPLQNVQVKVHADGVMEASLGAITKNISFENMPSSILQQLPKALPDIVPVYVRGRMDVVSPTKVALNIQRIELGRIPMPKGLLSAENQRKATDYVNQRISNIKGLSIQQLLFQDGKVRFKGTFPKGFKRQPI